MIKEEKINPRLILYREKYREQALHDEYRTKLTTILEQISHNEVQTQSLDKMRSRIFYELAYSAYMNGQYQLSIENYEQSNIYALKSGHDIGHSINLCHQTKVKFFNGDISAQKAQGLLIEQETRINELYHKTYGGLEETWTWNVHFLLMEIDLILNDVEDAELRRELIFKHKVSQPFNDPDSELYEAMKFWVRSIETFSDFIAGRYEEALHALTYILDFERIQSDAAQYMEDPSLKWYECQSKEFFIAGKSHKILGNEQMSQKCFECGMMLNPAYANHYYQKLIQKEISSQ